VDPEIKFVLEFQVKPGSCQCQWSVPVGSKPASESAAFEGNFPRAEIEYEFELEDEYDWVTIRSKEERAGEE
jgi:hypothetical protein